MRAVGDVQYRTDILKLIYRLTTVPQYCLYEPY